jgi:poly(hydroxyalkanoate) depolymerase family esterase
MIRRLAVASALVLAGLVALPGHAAQQPASFTHHTYAAVDGRGARDYWVYVPAGAPRANRPLVVFLHGCNETAEQAAAASRFNEVAARRGFVVVYPEQQLSAPSTAPLADGNGLRCWNWFLPEDQERDAGEPATIVGITRQVTQRLRLDRTRTYVGGISAGAVMSVVLAATYPDVYAAAGSMAGCAYRTCADQTGELAYRAMGERARVVPLLVENGTADAANPVAQSLALTQSWLGVDDRADDGALNGSISRQPARAQTFGADQTPSPGSGDPCVHNNTWTCPGGVVGFTEGYPHTVARYDDAAGCEVLQLWVIHGMAHAYPNGPKDHPYTDPLGPDVTTAMYDFFAHHRLGRSCATS